MRMKNKSTFILRAGLQSAVYLLIALFSFSQGRTVTGKVTSSQDQSGLTGVSVQVKGSKTGTTTDANGNYTITVPSANSVLVFSFTGRENQQVTVGSQSEINVALEPSNASLEEVVVSVGYGTQRKSDLTGAVSAVRAAQLQERPAASLNQAMAGRM